MCEDVKHKAAVRLVCLSEITHSTGKWTIKIFDLNIGSTKNLCQYVDVGKCIG